MFLACKYGCTKLGSWNICLYALNIAVLRSLSSEFHYGLGLAPCFLVGMLVLAASTSASVNSDATVSNRLVIAVFPAFRIPSCKSQEGARLPNAVEFSVLHSARFVRRKVENKSQSASSVLNWLGCIGLSTS